MSAAQAGDREALDALLRIHYDRIWAVCRRIAGNDHDAADATQEALIILVRRLELYDGRSSFGTWAYRVATNACLDELRRRTRRPTPVDSGVFADRGDPGSDSRVAEGVAARVDVDRALAALPVDFRAAVALRDLAGLDYASISEVLGVPPGTVRSRIARGRAAIAELLQGNPSPAQERPRGEDL